LGSFLITTTTSLLGPPSSYRGLCSYLGGYLTILYSTTIVRFIGFLIIVDNINLIDSVVFRSCEP
jgi:hypothetical protein